MPPPDGDVESVAGLEDAVDEGHSAEPFASPGGRPLVIAPSSPLPVNNPVAVTVPVPCGDTAGGGDRRAVAGVDIPALEGAHVPRARVAHVDAALAAPRAHHAAAISIDGRVQPHVLPADYLGQQVVVRVGVEGRDGPRGPEPGVEERGVELWLVLGAVGRVGRGRGVAVIRDEDVVAQLRELEEELVLCQVGYCGCWL